MQDLQSRNVERNSIGTIDISGVGTTFNLSDNIFRTNKGTAAKSFTVEHSPRVASNIVRP